MRGWRGRAGTPPLAKLATMTAPVPSRTGLTPVRSRGPPQDTLAAVVSRAGKTQLHVAETEKYAHVTYFFNGGVEQRLRGEDGGAGGLPARRGDLRPQAADERPRDHRRFLAAFHSDHPAFSVINFANADMVGHTGVIPATVLAVQTIDECLGKIIAKVDHRGGVCVITADHGNAESMLTADGAPNTAHSTNPVPLILTSSDRALAGEGTLSDVAPTVLALLGLEQPTAMTGHSLLRQ